MCAKVKEAFVSGRAISHGIKFIPFAGVSLLTLHVIFLILGVHEAFTVSVSIVLLVALLILMSVKFHYCALHKSLILYMSLVTGCICIQKVGGFGESLTGTRWVVLIVGVFLIALSFYKCKSDGCGKQ